MRSNYLMSLIVTIAIAALVGCGGGSSSSTPVVQPVAISVSPVTPPNLRPGQTQQFKATVTGSNNTAVTWSVAGSSSGSIDQNGLYTAPSAVPSQIDVTITATAVADTTKSANATATLLALVGLTVKPLGPALAVGGSQPLSAKGLFSDNSKHDWTSQSTWSSADTTVASIGATSGVATGASLGVTTITAAFGGVTATTAVNVTSMSMDNSNLKGQYAFSLVHADIRGQGFVVGSFVADGNGNITAGNEDSSSAIGNTPLAGLAITGTYNVYLDGRGTLTLTTSHATNTYTFILSNDAPSIPSTPSSHGRLILSGTAGIFVGTLELATPATGMSGNYALLLGGMDGTLLTGSTAFQNSEVLAGQFSTSAGTGVLDVNDNATINGVQCNSTCPPPANSLAFAVTSITPVDSNGRGTLHFMPPSQLQTQVPSPANYWTFAYYVVSANKVLLIQTDAQTAPTSTTPTVAALAGTAELQTSTSFSNTDIAGNAYAFLLERSASSGVFGAAGQWTFAAANALSGEMDVNKVGTTVKVAISSGATYGTIAANGRGTVSIPSASTTPVTPSLNSAVFYLISSGTSSGKMYVLETDVKPNGGVAEQQTNTATPLTGILSFRLGQLATNGFDSSYSGQLVNLSNFDGIGDSNVGTNCAPGSTNCVVSQASGKLGGSPFASADIFGRGAATISLLSQTNTSYGYYLVTPQKMLVFGTPPTSPPPPTYQAVDGVIEIQ